MAASIAAILLLIRGVPRAKGSGGSEAATAGADSGVLGTETAGDDRTSDANRYPRLEIVTI
jgi:hypothetical protein